VSAANQKAGVQLVASSLLNPGANAGRGGLEAMGGRVFTPAEQAALDKGSAVYKELCFACHGDDGRGAPAPEGSAAGTRAPALAASPRVNGHRDYVIKTLMHGLTGPVNGVTYTEVMIPMGQNPDDWIAAVGSYVRNAFGNRSSMITAGDVARVRAATKNRKTSWSVAEIESTLPRMALVDNGWKVTASHNAATASDALSIRPWTSGQPQKPGMWLQVELPQPITVNEVQFESAPATVEAAPAAAGAPTRTGIPGRGGPGAGPGAAPAPPPPIGYPRAFDVQVSMDGTTWGPAVAKGEGTGTSTSVTFPPTRAKFVRITQTGSAADAPPWSVLRLRLYETPAATASR
jgi:mono/diheme cytochrome c family protein